MRRFFDGFLGALLGLILAGPALASGYTDLNSGIAAFVRSDVDGTIKFMSAAIASPDLPAKLRPVAYFDRGLAYAQKGNNAQALADMSACLALAPDYNEALLTRSYLLQQDKQSTAALADLTVLISKRPFLAEPYILRGTIYADQNKIDAALADYDHVVNLDPRSFRIRLVRADLFRRAGRYDEALKDNDMAIALNQNLGEVYTERGRTYEAKGDYDSALADYRKGVQLTPDDRDGYLLIGLLQWNTSHFRDSIDSFEHWLRDSPSAYGVIWIDLARNRSNMSDSELGQNAARFDLGKWPGAVVRLLMGTTSPEAALQAANVGDAKVVPGQICEANFYIAQWYLLHKNAGAAKPMLQKAASSCPTDFVELRSASVELKRLP
jgi:tetratricopeptide (TPR) repeat protein